MKKSTANMVLGGLLFLFVVYKGLLYHGFFFGAYPKVENCQSCILGNKAFFSENPNYYIVARNLDKNTWGLANMTRLQLYCDSAVLVMLALVFAINRKKNSKQE